MSKNFWNCFEVDCISRDYDYATYVRVHEYFELKHARLSEKAYNDLKKIFNEERINGSPTTHSFS